MRGISRKQLRCSLLDEDCKNAEIVTHLDGESDNRVFCLGLYIETTCWEIKDKCFKCPAFVLNAEIIKE